MTTTASHQAASNGTSCVTAGTSLTAATGAPFAGGQNENLRGTGAPATNTRTARLPWFPHYPGTFMSETRGWPLLARGAFRELLDAQWDLGQLPNDPKQLRILIGATRHEWRKAWPFVEPRFPPLVSGGFRQNPALEALRKDSQDRLDRRRAASQRAHEVRWGKRGGRDV